MPFERCVLAARRTCGYSCVDAARYVGRGSLGMRLASKDENNGLGMRLGSKNED